MRFIPLAVLKLARASTSQTLLGALHAIHTACGIETREIFHIAEGLLGLHAIHTACGIETGLLTRISTQINDCMQFIPLAVLKRGNLLGRLRRLDIACNSYRLRYWNGWICGLLPRMSTIACNSYRLRYWNSFIGLKWIITSEIACNSYRLRYWNENHEREIILAESIACNSYRLRYWNTLPVNLTPSPWQLHAIHTACGIETSSHLYRAVQAFPLHAIYTACGIFIFRCVFSNGRFFYDIMELSKKKFSREG